MYNMRTGNKTLIKNINTALIIREIRIRGPISRTDISKNVDLGLSTVTKICDQLVENDLIINVGIGESTGGRKPIKFAFNDDYGYIIGIDFGINSMTIAITNLEPSIIFKKTYSFQKGADFVEVKDMLMKGVAYFVKKITDEKSNLLAIAISIPGIVDYDEHRLISSSLLGWENIDFREIFENTYGVNVYIDNNANCYALYQNQSISGCEYSNFVSILLGNGIGAGNIISNKLYRGAWGGAGEIGHMIIDIDGKECLCGQRGCLERYASEEFVIKYVKEKTGHQFKYDEIYEKAIQGNKYCYQALEKENINFANSIINVIMHLNPEKIIISGKDIDKHELFNSLILKIVEENWFNRIGCKTEIEFKKYNNEEVILGASLLVLDDVLQIPLYKDQSTLVDNVL